MAGLTDRDRRPDWEYLTQCEPRLKDLEKIVDGAVKYLPDTEAHWCANRFMGHIKSIMKPFVGRVRGYPVAEAINPAGDLPVLTMGQLLDRDDDQYKRPATTVHESLLRSSEAYDVVYTHLYAKLPGCRGCYCL